MNHIPFSINEKNELNMKFNIERKAMSIYDIACQFIQDQALFGAYPTPEYIQYLEEWGVDIIVNLTYDTERKIKPYTTTKEVIHFPIPDRSVPQNKYQFTALVLYLKSMIDSSKKIYIHCKAGHGRSGVLAASLLCLHLNITPTHAIEITSAQHATRKNMKQRWRIVGSPQTFEQKNFIKSIFKEHVLCETSPLIAIDVYNLPTEAYLEEFLMQTYLGKITGVNGKRLEKLRESLFAIRYPSFDIKE